MRWTCFALVALGLSLRSNAQTPEFVFVFLNKKIESDNTPKEVVDKLMEGHMANIRQMSKEGRLVAAGPFDGGGGIYIFRSSSTEEVKGWIQADPAVKANRWNVEVLPYFPRLGSVCSVTEPIQMVMYTFIRFIPDITKFNISYSAESMRSHDVYMERLGATGNVVTEATFGPSDGGILVILGEVENSITDEDPAVTDAVLTADIKKLYIARGSFCEK